MNRDEIFATIRRTMARTFDVPESAITEATIADDIETWDSVSHLVLLTGLEKRFNVALPTDEVNAAQDVGGLLDIIERTLAGGGTGSGAGTGPDAGAGR
jgi:acyl carrier protein